MTKRKKQITPPLSPKSDDSFEDAFLREDRHKNGKPRPSANARERERMRVLSKAFSRLKTTLPWVPADTKLSKLDTLRLACSYIAHLKQILDEDSSAVQTKGDASMHPVALTWPYTFSGKVTATAPEQKKSQSVKNPSTDSREHCS